MSNRLSFAHAAPRREAFEVLPVLSPVAKTGGLARALTWLREAAANRPDEFSPAVRRDLGLPETAAVPFAFAYEVERSRVRV